MNVLAIGAHFDDVEIGCSGSLAKHRSMGDRVIILVITDSKYDDYNDVPIRSSDIALKEGKKGAEALGCELICSHYKTKQVQFSYKVIEDINKVIDENEIDTVYTHWDFDVHQDHQAVGKATLCAARKINRILMYQSNLYMNTQSFNANYYVDISKFIEIKKKAILCHKSEVEKFGEEWLNFWINEAANNGKKFNVRYAEAFQMVKYLA